MKEKQIEKVSKRRQEYLKFKPFADDLRKAESWCELDSVLNRYQTVKNLTKMGYRKASDVAREIFAEIEKIVAKEIRRCDSMREKCIDDPIYWEGGRHSLQQARYWLAELKKKYTESEDTE